MTWAEVRTWAIIAWLLVVIRLVVDIGTVDGWPRWLCLFWAIISSIVLVAVASASSTDGKVGRG